MEILIRLRLIITQLLIVEQNRKYRLDFSYKTSEIVTGGIPVLLLIPKKERFRRFDY